MWLEVDGISYYVSSFSEGGFTLTFEHLFGWKIQNSSGMVLEDLMFWPTDLDNIKALMPKTHAMLKEQVKKDERN